MIIYIYFCLNLKWVEFTELQELNSVFTVSAMSGAKLDELIVFWYTGAFHTAACGLVCTGDILDLT